MQEPTIDQAVVSMSPPETGCVAYTRDGPRCGCTVGLLEEADRMIRCTNHSIDGRDHKVREGASKGGRRSHTRDGKLRPPMETGPMCAADCMTWSSWAIHQVAMGGLTPNAGSRVGALIKCYLESLKIAELEGQIRDLQAQVRAAK